VGGSRGRTNAESRGEEGPLTVEEMATPDLGVKLLARRKVAEKGEGERVVKNGGLGVAKLTKRLRSQWIEKLPKDLTLWKTEGAISGREREEDDSSSASYARKDLAKISLPPETP